MDSWSWGRRAQALAPWPAAQPSCSPRPTLSPQSPLHAVQPRPCLPPTGPGRIWGLCLLLQQPHPCTSRCPAPPWSLPGSEEGVPAVLRPFWGRSERPRQLTGSCRPQGRLSWGRVTQRPLPLRLISLRGTPWAWGGGGLPGRAGVPEGGLPPLPGMAEVASWPPTHVGSPRTEWPARAGSDGAEAAGQHLAHGPESLGGSGGLQGRGEGWGLMGGGGHVCGPPALTSL